MRFYAYRAYRSIYRTPRPHSLDILTGETPRPAGDVMAFSSRRERDSYVAQGFEEVMLHNGVQYRALSAIDARTAKKLKPCHDGGWESCFELKDCAAHGKLKSELDAEASYFNIY